MRPVASPALFCVLAAWVILGLATVIRRRPPKARETQRGRGWAWGGALHTLSVATLWAWPRTEPPHWLLSAIAVPLAAASVAVMLACQRTLGSQFAYQARLVEGHRLITAGPYRYVRHPIYTALFGLGLATGLVVSRWPVIPIFAVLYVAGTVIRIRSEERLLRAAFGAEFDDYARRVPAFIPIPVRWCKL